MQAVVDVLDKFLISKRKVEALSYTFYTIVTGLFILLLWPFQFAHISNYYLILSLLSGALFSLAIFVYFKALEQGEASRVIPFVYGLVPLFDIFIQVLIGKNILTLPQGAALFLLIPGALLMGYKGGKVLTKHVGTKILAAFLLSSYFVLWNAASYGQPVFNNLMWNRVGGAFVLVVPLIFAPYRKKIFSTQKVKEKGSTSFLFIFKQLLGGATFIFLSFLLAKGNVSLINALQGFRYVFLFIIALFISRHYRHILEEDTNSHIVRQKVFAMSLIVTATIILFIV